jgi:hypothetical protein
LRGAARRALPPILNETLTRPAFAAQQATASAEKRRFAAPGLAGISVQQNHRKQKRKSRLNPDAVRQKALNLVATSGRERLGAAAGLLTAG